MTHLNVIREGTIWKQMEMFIHTILWNNVVNIYNVYFFLFKATSKMIAHGITLIKCAFEWKCLCSDFAADVYAKTPVIYVFLILESFIYPVWKNDLSLDAIVVQMQQPIWGPDHEVRYNQLQWWIYNVLLPEAVHHTLPPVFWRQ